MFITCSYDYLEIIEAGVENGSEHAQDWLLQEHHDSYSADTEIWEETETQLPESDAISSGWLRDVHATRARRLCGDWSDKLKLLRYQSRGNVLRLRFRADHSRHYAGFRAKITVTDYFYKRDIIEHKRYVICIPKRKVKPPVSKRKKKPPVSKRKKKPPVSKRKKKPPVSKRKKKPPVSKRKKKPPVSKRKKIPPVSKRKKKPPVSKRKKKPPVSKRKKKPPVSKRKKKPPVSKRKKKPPVSKRKKKPPVSKRKKIPPVSKRKKKPPVSKSERKCIHLYRHSSTKCLQRHLRSY
ncbi:unnamed protein product [Arctia plantaginis]|uniref:CUB domain-containing protein n=1 Tax=Arctia plantaginis TaxID=874455 RepID=A0A8S0YMA9_ARCPL|nr:unnamed protein product [Arctia plantaginis]